MEGAGPTPSPTRWCSLAALQPVIVTLWHSLFLPGGEGEARAAEPISACSVPGGKGAPVGFRIFDTPVRRGSEVGLHSTGVSLPFFLSVRLLSIILALFPHPTPRPPNHHHHHREITCQNIDDLSVHFGFEPFSAKDSVLMHRCFSLVLSV